MASVRHTGRGIEGYAVFELDHCHSDLSVPTMPQYVAQRWCIGVCFGPIIQLGVKVQHSTAPQTPSRQLRSVLP